jgi:hypothetical protein
MSMSKLPDWRKAAHDLWARAGFGTPPDGVPPWFLTIDDVEVALRPSSDERQLVLVARIMKWDGSVSDPSRLAESVLQRNYASLIVAPFRVRIQDDHNGRPALIAEALYDLADSGAKLSSAVSALVDHALAYRMKFAPLMPGQVQRVSSRASADQFDRAAQMIFRP